MLKLAHIKQEQGKLLFFNDMSTMTAYQGEQEQGLTEQEQTGQKEREQREREKERERERHTHKERERERDRQTDRDRQTYRQNSNSKTLMLKDSSVRSNLDQSNSQSLLYYNHKYCLLYTSPSPRDFG